MTSIKVNAILEVLGRPAENVTEALKIIVDRMKNEKELKLISNRIHEPVAVKDSDNLFTSFMEVELELPSLNHLFSFLFVYMPANIEIIHPENLSISNHDLNLMTNQLMQRIHQYDAIAKNALSEKDFVMKKLYEVAPHLFKQKEEQSQPAPSVNSNKKDNRKVKSKKKKK
jgi:7,8-dihydro-6-hydroxymethylpterin-pyrophosphokinase